MKLAQLDGSFPVKIDERAWQQVAKLIERRGGEDSFLRIGVKGGGCSGLEYLFKLDDQPKAIDSFVEKDGVRIACDAKSARFLQGATLVYTGNLIGGGFAFENPNAERQCGCGTSFTPKPQ